MNEQPRWWDRPADQETIERLTELGRYIRREERRVRLERLAAKPDEQTHDELHHVIHKDEP